MTADIDRTIDAVWRLESGRVIAALARIVRDIGVAEDLAQDALVAALQQWPESGVPDNPGAWLTAAAKHRAIDYLRRGQMLARKHGELAYELDSARPDMPDLNAALDDDVGDDMLRLIFTACHPVLSAEARVALTLRMVGGLTTDEIARAFLVPEPTMAQRIVRAKKTLADQKVPFEVPRGEDRRARLASVLEVVYLVFNEGYAATAGEHWMRAGLCEDALRLARMLAALLEIQASRLRARVGPGGEPVLLKDQNRALWDQLLIRRGLAALARTERLGGAAGPYALQAAIAACHARAASLDSTDWVRITALYEMLSSVQPSPVVELNRAVAISRAFGAAAGLAHLDRLEGRSMLKNYHLLPSVRGDLLEQLGRHDEARDEFQRAAELTRNETERKLLLERARLTSRSEVRGQK